MIMIIKSPNGNTFYTCLPVSVSQLDVLCTIKNHVDHDYEIVHIYDYSGTFDDDEFVTSLDQI